MTRKSTDHFSDRDLKERINEAVFDVLDELESNPEMDITTDKAAQVITDTVYAIIIERPDDGVDDDPFAEPYPQDDGEEHGR